MQNIYVHNKLVGKIEDAGSIIRARDAQNRVLGYYNKAADITYHPNGQFHSRGNNIRMMIR